MKNNIMIIVLVTLVALGVIITVIIASVAGNSEKQPPDSSDSSSYVLSEDPVSDSYPIPADSDPQSGSQSGSDSGYTVGDDIVTTARAILEREDKVPFLENGADLEGFDNSGFIYYVLRENGFITCPRGLQAQTAMGRRLEYDELKRGDLVFFYNEDDFSAAGYGGIYTGRGTMIACLMPGTYVDEINISGSYHREHFFCGVSLS